MKKKITKKQKIVVKGLFFKNKNKKEILLLKNKHGYWDIPGGHMEFGETPEECLSREAAEEANAKIEALKLLIVQTVILEEYKKIKINHYISIIFEGRINSFINNNSSSGDDDEIKKYKWFTVDSVLKNKKIKILNFTKDLLVDLIDKGKIAKKKYFIKAGEINSYREINYK